MTVLLDAVQKFFDDDDWRYMKMEDDTVLMMDVTGKNGQFRCYARTREDQQQFIFYTLCPLTVPEDKRQAVAEYVARANYGMVIGNFEIDFRDGEVRYKTSIDVEGGELTSPMIRNLVFVSISMTDKYMPGIASILYAGMAPEAAIATVEG